MLHLEPLNFKSFKENINNIVKKFHIPYANEDVSHELSRVVSQLNLLMGMKTIIFARYTLTHLTY